MVVNILKYKGGISPQSLFSLSHGLFFTAVSRHYLSCLLVSGMKVHFSYIYNKTVRWERTWYNKTGKLTCGVINAKIQKQVVFLALCLWLAGFMTDNGRNPECKDILFSI